MVDFDRTMADLNPANIAGLRRFSARAALSYSPTAIPVVPYSYLAETAIARLRYLRVPVQTGLTDQEFSRVESELGFDFPPDLRAILAAGVPSGPEFPDWRNPSATSYLRAWIDLPAAAVSLQIARNLLWSKSLGPRPSDPEEALRVGRTALDKAPVLIPVFDRCYIPSKPRLGGNPIFFIDENRIFVSGSDLSDVFDIGSSFFTLGSSSRKSIGSRLPRVVEFWSKAADNSTSSRSFSPPPIERPMHPLPEWIGEYLEEMGSGLREAGWPEPDVAEIVEASGSRCFVDGGTFLDKRAVMDVLLLEAVRLAEALLKSGWSSDEVTELLGLDTRPERRWRPAISLPPDLAEKMSRRAVSLSLQ